MQELYMITWEEWKILKKLKCACISLQMLFLLLLSPISNLNICNLILFEQVRTVVPAASSFQEDCGEFLFSNAQCN